MGPDDHKVVGAYLAEVRRNASVTQVVLAQRLGKPQSFVSSFERGQRRVDFLEFVQIMRALGKDPEKVGRDLLKQVIPHVQPLATGASHRED